jgi:hypothetical protein
MTVSLHMIVRNDTEHLGECLESVRDLDETIVVDRGSTDHSLRRPCARRGTTDRPTSRWPESP